MKLQLKLLVTIAEMEKPLAVMKLQRRDIHGAVARVY
jgi:hypothetical protein